MKFLKILIYIFLIIFLITYIIIFLYIFSKKYIIPIYKNYLYFVNKKLYKILDEMEEYKISGCIVPPELKSYIQILNIPGCQKNPSNILNEFLKRDASLQSQSDNLFIFDVIDFSGAYFPSVHTDIEWNKVKNDGFQLWSLLENKNKTGNLFIYFNKYLYEK